MMMRPVFRRPARNLAEGRMPQQQRTGFVSDRSDPEQYRRDLNLCSV
jgi:hypothetical protein